MAKMIPDYIDQTDPRRNGERLVFDWLSEKNIPGTAYYSLLQKNHTHKLIGEIDFLYVSKRGFLCIEVKGGQDIYRKDGKWFSVNRRGEHNEIKNPFVQAKDCQYALKSFFASTYGKNSLQAKYLVGYAVIFPECKFTGSGNDLVTEVVFDAKYNLEDFPAYLDKVYDYWENLELIRHGVIMGKLTDIQLRQANDLLCGDFCVVPSMHLELQHVEQQMLELTKEQYDKLVDVEKNSRAIIEGAAGTGKSLLAVELIRRHAAKEKKSLYLCYNSHMADYAKISLSKCQYADATTFHALLMGLLNDDSLYTLSSAELSQKFIRNNITIKEKYSMIVIDEGQDLFNLDVFSVIDIFLENGLGKGKWAIFLDPNQNIFNPVYEYGQTMECIQEWYHPVLLTLNTNCRNTQPIASRTAALTITPPARYLKLSGPKVITRSYNGRDDFLSLFTRELQSLLSSGVSATDIVILSRYKKLNSQLFGIKKICNLEIIENNNIRMFKDRSLNYFTVQSFKGLESKIVFYIDVDGFGSIKDRMLNYVAMSRARLQLYIFYDVSKKQEYEDTLDKGTELLA